MMLKKKDVLVAFLTALCLSFVLSTAGFVTSSTQWDPWSDVSGPTLGVPDGTVNMRDINYLIQKFNTKGTPIDRANMLSIVYDSGWTDVSDMAGQYFDVVHNLNSTNLVVDIQGKTTLDGGAHQKYFGGTDFVAGWNKTYGGTGRDFAEAVVQTFDGGYAMAGYTDSYGAGNADFWLLKTDASGNAQWNKTYGGTIDEAAYCLVQTSDGGYALAGATDSFGAGDYEAWLVKTDANGNMQWNKTYGGTGAEIAYFGLVQTGDGGYTLAGWTNSFGAGNEDFWVVKTDANGNMQWNKTYGGTSDDRANDVIQTADGGYAIAGYASSFGAGLEDAWLIKTDAAGNAVDGFKYGLAWVGSTPNTIELYRGTDDEYWNFIRIQIWKRS